MLVPFFKAMKTEPSMLISYDRFPPSIALENQKTPIKNTIETNVINPILRFENFGGQLVREQAPLSS